MAVIYGSYSEVGCFFCEVCLEMDDPPGFSLNNKKVCTNCYIKSKVESDPVFVDRLNREANFQRRANHQPKKDIDKYLRDKYG